MVAKIDSFNSKVSLNMATNLIHTVVMALIGFLMVPYYIGEFGLSTYAIIPLSITVTTYFIALSDCLASAFARYMGVAVQTSDPERINRTFTTSLSGMGKVMLVMAPVAVVISMLAPYVFDISDSAVHDVQMLFIMIIASSMMISFSACLSSVFMAYNKMYITSLSKIVHCVTQVGIVLVLFGVVGAHLQIIGASYLAASSLLLCILAFNLKRVCPTLKVSRAYYDRKLLKDMGGLGLWSTVSEFGALMFMQASMVIVNLMLGSELQGSFSIVANMSSMINTACASLGVAATPLLYRCYANKDHEGIVRTLKIFTKFVGILMAFPLAFLMVFAPQVLGIWLGSGYDSLYPLIYIMMPIEVTICTVNALIVVPVVYLKVKKVVMATLLCGVMNVVLSMCFITFTDLGLVGVLLSWGISILSLKFLFYPSYTSLLTSNTLKKYYPSLAWSYAMLVILLCLGFAFNHFFLLPTTWSAVLTLFFLTFVVYFLLVMRFSFSSEERKVVITYLPGFVQRLFRD